MQLTAAVALMMAACTAVKLGVEDPTWEQWRNLWDFDNDGEISGAELRGRENEEEWRQDLEQKGWLGSLRTEQYDQYALANSMWVDLGGAASGGCISQETFEANFGSSAYASAVFDWADSDAGDSKTGDDCITQFEFEKLMLFWLGEGDQHQINQLDSLIFG